RCRRWGPCSRPSLPARPGSPACTPEGPPPPTARRGIEAESHADYKRAAMAAKKIELYRTVAPSRGRRRTTGRSWSRERDSWSSGVEGSGSSSGPRPDPSRRRSLAGPVRLEQCSAGLNADPVDGGHLQTRRGGPDRMPPARARAKVGRTAQGLTVRFARISRQKGGRYDGTPNDDAGSGEGDLGERGDRHRGCRHGGAPGQLRSGAAVRQLPRCSLRPRDVRHVRGCLTTTAPANGEKSCTPRPSHAASGSRGTRSRSGTTLRWASAGPSAQSRATSTPSSGSSRSTPSFCSPTPG